MAHVPGVVAWTRNNGMEALEAKLKSKYGEGIKKYAWFFGGRGPLA